MDSLQKEELKKIFAGLEQTQRDHLMSAFDKMESCFVEYQTGKFIACHLDFIAEHLKILGQSEYWYFGDTQ